MAANTILANLDNIEVYQCAVCLNNMLDRNPRFMECHHSFCEKCLESMMTNRGKIACPTCRTSTVVPGKDVTNLPINFIVMNLKEQFANVLSKGLSVCSLCYQNKAIGKCYDCLYNMCETCSSTHTGMDLFKNHVIKSLCEKHHDGITTHICLLCNVPVCTKCIMQDHHNHQNMIKTIEEGTAKLKEKLIALNNEVKSDISRIETTLHDDVVDEVKKQKDEIKKIIAVHRTLAEAAEKALSDLENIELENEGIKHDVDIVLTKLTALSLETEETLSAEWKQLLASYPKLHEERNELKEAVSKSYKFMSSPFKVEPVGKEHAACLMQVDFKWLDTPVLKRTFSQVGSLKIQNPIAVTTTAKPEIIIVADKGSNVAFEINLDEDSLKQLGGRVIDYGIIKDVNYFNDQIFLLYEGAIMVYGEGLKAPDKIFTPYPNMSKMYVVSADYIIITRKTGEVCVFDSEENLSKTVAKGLQNPSYITQWSNGLATKYLITEYGKSRIHIYNKEWDCFRTLSPLKDVKNSLYGIAATTKGALVASRQTSTVDLYSVEGELISHVLDSSHGIHNPVAISFARPYLWITENSPGNVKCYKVIS